MAKSLTYQQGQLHCGLRVGDWVQVVATCPAFTNGWPESWEPAMSRAVGLFLQIEEIDPRCGIRLSGAEYYFPFFVLEKLNDTL